MNQYYLIRQIFCPVCGRKCDFSFINGTIDISSGTKAAEVTLNCPKCKVKSISHISRPSTLTAKEFNKILERC
jgi:hypothetical protein